MENNNQTDNKSGRGPIFNHYRSLTEALAMAMTKCIVWRETEKGTPVSAKQLFDFCQKYDAEHPLREEEFYMVSREGAIGISPGLEWLTRWMFIPMEPCKERDFAFRKMQEDIREELQEEQKAEAAPDLAPKFCTHCGAKLALNSRFCTSCGKPIDIK